MKKQKHIGKKKGQVKLPVIKTKAKEVKKKFINYYRNFSYIVKLLD